MTMVNTPKPSASSFTNSTRVSSAELWGTIITTWATETRTWAACASVMVNSTKPRTLGSYTFDEIGTQTIDETGGTFDGNQMINTPKPV